MPVAYFQNTCGTLVLCWWRVWKRDGRSYCTCSKHNMEHCISTLLLTEYSLALNGLYCNHTHAESEIEPDYITASEIAACLIWPGDSGHSLLDSRHQIDHSLLLCTSKYIYEVQPIIYKTHYYSTAFVFIILYSDPILNIQLVWDWKLMPEILFTIYNCVAVFVVYLYGICGVFVWYLWQYFHPDVGIGRHLRL